MHCTRRKMVWSKKLHKKVRRCAKWSGHASRSRGYRRGRKRARSKRAGYRRGHRPFNAGKRCAVPGISIRTGKPTCFSWGGTSPKYRHRSRPLSYAAASSASSSAWLGPWVARQSSGEGFVERSVGGFGYYRR